MARYRLWCIFRGWQWPLRDGDFVEIRTETLEVVAQLPAALVEAVLAHHLDGLALLTLRAGDPVKLTPSPAVDQRRAG